MLISEKTIYLFIFIFIFFLFFTFYFLFFNFYSYSLFFFIILFYFILFYFILFYFILFYFILFYFASKEAYPIVRRLNNGQKKKKKKKTCENKFWAPRNPLGHLSVNKRRNEVVPFDICFSYQRRTTKCLDSFISHKKSKNI